MNDLNQKILEEFLIESFENLSSINAEITRYEKSPEDGELLNAIYRKVHTLKGSASFLGFKKLERITHVSENRLNELQEGTLKIDSGVTDILLESFDICISILKDIEKSGSEPEEDFEELIKKIDGIGGEMAESPVKAIEDTLSEKSLMNTGSKSAPVNEKKPELKVVEVENPINSSNDKKTENVETSEAPAVRAPTVESTIRVNVSLLDKIMNVVGELVLNRNQILQYTQMANDSELTRLGHQLNVITTELQTDIMTTRMQPVGSVFSKFERIVRDLAKSQNKKINLEILGGETELDKSLLEMIKDPMTHLIRNAADHGIELPEVRLEKGKPESGKMTIKAYHEGGQVNIDIIDDGNGLSREKIINKAISKGIITAESAETMSDQKVYNLIFSPGFSTAETVTNISGRGVGMDVVKSNIESVSGKVEVLSVEGEGSTFRLKIPLTLAIVPALVVQSGNETFALPQKNLVELVHLGSEDIDKIEKIHGNDFYRLRGDLIPVFYLNKSLKLEESPDEPSFINIVFLNAEGSIYGLVVDDIRDTQEIVVKPLSSGIKTENIFAGATLMGDGRVALIIDAFGFYNMFNSSKEKAEAEELNQDSLSDYDQDSFEILLCQLADGRMYGIPLCLVNRLEDYDTGEIVWSGDQALIKYRERAMPLINIEKSLELKKNGILETALNNKENSTKLYIIVVDIGGTNIGLVVEQILDIARLNDIVDDKNSDRDGIMGTIFSDEELVSVLDVHKLYSMLKHGKDTREQCNFSGKRFLVVDDSSFYRKIISDLLMNCGADVQIFHNGAEAFEDLKDNLKNYDFIVTDIEMPVMDGCELAEKVRELDNGKSLPILAVSTLDDEKGNSAGFSEKIRKFDQREFLEKVNSLIS
jgi:two-component system chemotaxis sensor kinase CheA